MRLDFRAFVPLFLAASGCLTENGYARQRADLDCDIVAYCDDQSTCASQSDFQGGSCLRFDRSAAAECLDALESNRDEAAASEDPLTFDECIELRNPPECDDVHEWQDGLGCNSIEGRPLHDEGEVHLASVRTGETWSGVAPVKTHEAAARAWLEAARYEHASVAAFARLSMELMGLGAPPELVARAHQAALEEIDHAKRCLGVARSLGGEAFDLGALPMVPAREPDLARLAIEALREGCVGEGSAAMCARLGAAKCEGEQREVLERIALDELGHAALAWSTLGWALERDPTLAQALHRELPIIRRELLEALREAGGESVPEFGVLSGVERAAVALEVFEQIVEPALAQLLARPEASQVA